MESNSIITISYDIIDTWFKSLIAKIIKIIKTKIKVCDVRLIESSIIVKQTKDITVIKR